MIFNFKPDAKLGVGAAALSQKANSLRLIADELPAIVFVLNAAGACIHSNRRWSEYAGVSRSHQNEATQFALIHPDDVVGSKERWETGINGGKEFEIGLRLRRHDGVYRLHAIRVAPQRETNQKLESWVALATDIETYRQAELQSETNQAELKKANEELEHTLVQRNHELQEVVEQLEAFAYSIAHDMRAPLRAMHQYAQTVAQDFATAVPPEAKGYLNKIMNASEKLDTLIREVLIYTRVSQGRIEMQSINLERLLSEVLLMHPHLSTPEVELNARLPLHAVVGDETALTQVFSNLLNNAVKFVPQGRKPVIQIWTEDQGEAVRIFFKDNGIGIPQAATERIFKMFERLQPESKYEGSGIGLSIVRRAVERMDGRLGVTSIEGEGSTFWVELKRGESA